MVTGYSPHYLMFIWRPRLSVDLYFPTVGSTEAPTREVCAKCVDEYIASVWDRLRTYLREAQTQSTAEECWQKWCYDWKIGTVNLKPGDLVLVKADAFKGKRNLLLLITSDIGVPLCIGIHHAWDRYTSPIQHKPTSKGSEDRMMPQESSGIVVTQHPVSKTSLRWIDGKFMTSTMDIYQSVHWRWVKTPGNVMWL